jgi:hypothetical protein
VAFTGKNQIFSLGYWNNLIFEFAIVRKLLGIAPKAD